jgi:hypothetical protein
MGLHGLLQGQLYHFLIIIITRVLIEISGTAILVPIVLIK